MAQYFFEAADYPLGTKLTEIGFLNLTNSGLVVEVVQDTNGNNVWRRTDGNAGIFGTYFAAAETSTFTTTEVFTGHYGVVKVADRRKVRHLHRAQPGAESNYQLWLRYQDTIGITGGLTRYLYQSGSETEIGDNLSYLGSGYNYTGPFSYRTQIADDDKAYVSVWEPTVPDFSSNSTALSDSGFAANNTFTSGEPGLAFDDVPSETQDIAVIGIGTDGDPAPAARPTPPPVIPTPTGLTVSNITETSADLSWSAG